MDRLNEARNLLLAVFAFSAFALAALWIDSWFGPGWRGPAWEEPGFLHGMSGLALAPSGGLVRNPEAQVQAVDLRFVPGLPASR